MSCTPSPKVDRRGFLRNTLALGAVVAAVNVAQGSTPAPQPQTSAATQSSAGYQLTRHVADYYKTADL
ncbi:MAG: formate dehydrogenase [Candidatus Competibacterales bacterium]